MRRTLTLTALLLGGLLPAPLIVHADTPLPVVRSSRGVISVREGTRLQRDAWTLSPETAPDVFEAGLPSGKPQRVVFITDVDSIAFQVREHGRYDFVIDYNGAKCWTRIVGVRVVPASVFDAAYQKAHRGTIVPEVSEAYELVNIALAMTATGIADRNLVFHDSPYYQAVREWFEPYRMHPAITALDSALKQNGNGYFNLKMNGYAFVFDRAGRLRPSPVYDRTGFVDERQNSLRPYLAQLQAFADTSRFREFFRQHKSVYDSQVAFFRDTADVQAMRVWLDREFPRSSGYDGYRVIFSPLVAYNQSATWLESNGYRELQAHVNFPYPSDMVRRARGVALTPEGEVLLRSDIVFTELNHGYINPEADRYADRVRAATDRREHWVDPAKGPRYYTGMGAFNEYMNWALVSLRAVDFASEPDQRALITIVDRMMTQSRGFPRFAAFDAHLIELYRNRPPGTTVADLYPRILEWFEAENASGP